MQYILNMEGVNENRRLTSAVDLHLRNKRSENGYSSGFVDISHKSDNISSVYDEVVENTLPSSRQKNKGLTYRRTLARQPHSTADVARQYRNAAPEVESRKLHEFQLGVVKRVKPMTDAASYVWNSVNFWSHQFKEIEGKCGTSTASYFRFTRWLIKVNFMVFFLFLCFIYIPQLMHDSLFDKIKNVNYNVSGKHLEKMLRCSSSYSRYIKNISNHEPGWQTFLDIAQGDGILENTLLFYGYYTNLTFINSTDLDTAATTYNMGLAYLLTVGMSLLIVFIMIVKNSSKTIKEAVIDFDSNATALYSNSVLCVWDFCINTKKTALFKKRNIFNDFKATLEELEAKRQREKRTTKEKTKLYMKRALINLVVLALLGGSFYAIYVATDYLLNNQTENWNGAIRLVISYLPSIVISVLNFIVPEIFLILSTLEEYTQSFANHITILRSVFLRLASVWVLIVSLYYRLIDKENKKASSCTEEGFNTSSVLCCGNTLWNSDGEQVKCWESYVGKQFYKLGIFDFISMVLVVFLFNFPRRIIYNSLGQKIWLINKIGISKFNLPLQVLDIVYSQTVCWMGMFFTPLLPAITFVKVLAIFFLKKFELFRVSESPQNVYRASRSYSFFQTVLLVSFIAVACLLGYMIGNLQPSMSCGPFRLYSSEEFVMFDVVSNEVNSWTEEPKQFIKYFGTVAFFLPAILVLLLAIYYHWAIAVGYKQMEELLKQQLKSESHDKQFLLARVAAIMKNSHHAYQLPP